MKEEINILDELNCLECKKTFELKWDLWVCEDCMELFDTEKIWRQHDNNELDALDFNESQSFREKYRIEVEK